MQARLNPYKAAPAAIGALAALEGQIKSFSLEQRLIELMKVRASQINGCAYCIHMHTRDARAAGETEERIYLLNAWRESPLYSARERAALEWTEAVTSVADGHVPDAAFAAARAQFSERELVELTVAIGAINAWNRIAIGFRSVHSAAARKAA